MMDKKQGASSGGSLWTWLASCKYWSPASKPQERYDSTRITGIVSSTGNDLDWRLKAGGGDELGGGHDATERWGLPTSRPEIDVTALIATVLDPVHTYLTLSFDRTIDALLQAAVDMGYSKRVASGRPEEFAGDAEPGHNPRRQRHPSIVILKHLTADPNTLNSVILCVLRLRIADTRSKRR
jgi:hypothetical protein